MTSAGGPASEARLRLGLDRVLILDEPGLARLGAWLAFDLRRGDILALEGPLGAGKTTLARALIRAALKDPAAEVPSPTFAVMQTYDAPAFHLTHADLYRLTGSGEAAELGLDNAASEGALLIEWPERAPELIPPTALSVELAPGPTSDTRSLTLRGDAAWAARLGRLDELEAHLDAHAWREAALLPMQGDASTRRYARLMAAGGGSVVLMDSPARPDGPPVRQGLSYSRLTHLAESVSAFAAVSTALVGAGLSAPRLVTSDIPRGILVLEDLGTTDYAAALAAGIDQRVLWSAALDVLIALRGRPFPAELPVPGGGTHRLPDYSADIMGYEVEVLPDWYVPFRKGAPCPPAARDAFLAAWQPLLDRLGADRTGRVLRDYHSPNLMWRADRAGLDRVGVLDVQDALVGPWAYDVVSLLQDARIDVAPDLEAGFLHTYLARGAAADPAFDRAAFLKAYHALGLQRATRILGVFARLAHRDRKPQYLRHIPRVERYLKRNLAALAADPLAGPLKDWYARTLNL